MNEQIFYRCVGFLKKIRLGWITPFLFLLKGEDPRSQYKAIFNGLILPLVSILCFLWGWEICSKQIVTKFGTVPGPKQVWSAWKGLGNETRMERFKELEHYYRLREKRIKTISKYSNVLNEFPGEVPNALMSGEVTAAMVKSKELFDEAKELMEVYNRLSVAVSLEKASDSISNLSFQSNQDYAKTLMIRSIPSEFAYKKRDESFRNNTDFIVEPDDSPDTAATKLVNQKEESKSLASAKANLLIGRQKSTTTSSKLALGIVTSLPNGMSKQLESFDAAAIDFYGPLNSWYQELLAKEKSSGKKYPGKTKVKMLVKAFEGKTYVGKDTYLGQILTSLKTVFFGFFIASMIAIPLGLFCGLNSSINNAINPLIQIFKPVSPLAWLPIVMIVVGSVVVSDDPMFELSFLNSAITVALCSLWPTLVNTSLGVSTTDRDFINVARVLKLGWFKKIAKIIIPAAMPLIFTGLRLSLGVGWMVLIAAEMLAQNPGLGKFVWDMFQNGSSETLSMIMVAVFTIGIIGFFLDTVMLSLQELVSFD